MRVLVPELSESSIFRIPVPGFHFQSPSFPLKFLEFWDLSRPPLAETLLELFEATQEYARQSKGALPTPLTTDGPQLA